MPRPLQSLPSPAAGVETAQVAVPLSHLRPNTSQCRQRFSYWPLEASFTLRARDLPVSLSSSATRDPASSTRAPPKTAFDAELSSQAKSLCAARARSWMQDSDTPVCPGLLVEHATTHPWALARWRQGTDLLISDLPTVPCRHPPHEIRQGEPPCFFSPHGALDVEESTASGALQAGLLRLRSSNFSSTGMSGNPIGIPDWLAEVSGVPVPVNFLGRSQDSTTRTPWGVRSALPLPWPFCAPHRPTRSTARPLAWGADAGYWPEGRASSATVMPCSARSTQIQCTEKPIIHAHRPRWRCHARPVPFSPSLGGRLPASCCGVLVGLRQRIPDGYVYPRRTVRQRGHCLHPSPTWGGSTLEGLRGALP